MTSRRGGKRPGAGRKVGIPNKATEEIKALAREHTAASMNELARLALHASSEQARVAAIKELFDRGYGKAAQTAEITHIRQRAAEMTDDELANIVARDPATQITHSLKEH